MAKSCKGCLVCFMKPLRGGQRVPHQPLSADNSNAARVLHVPRLLAGLLRGGAL